MSKETQFTNKQVRILREALSAVHKKAPPLIQKRIQTALLDFANSCVEVCQCEEKVFIERENKFACLNCGYRHTKKEGDVKLKVVK